MLRFDEREGPQGFIFWPVQISIAWMPSRSRKKSREFIVLVLLEDPFSILSTERLSGIGCNASLKHIIVITVCTDPVIIAPPIGNQPRSVTAFAFGWIGFRYFQLFSDRLD